MKFRRIFLIILDSFGIGATKDSDNYGDGTSNSLLNTLKNYNIELPNFKALGLFKLFDDGDYKTIGYYTKGIPYSKNKCSVISMQEMIGNKLEKRYQKFDLKYLDKDLRNLLETEIDRKIVISDTNNIDDMLKKYGTDNIRNGNIIINYNYYTLNIYAHESIIPLNGLTKIGQIFNDILGEKYFINKICVYNFKGTNNLFMLDKNCNIISFKEKNSDLLYKMKKKGLKIITIGKANKVFNINEITNMCLTNNDLDSVKKLIGASTFNFNGLCIANLSDLNICGHRRNPEKYANVLKSYDHLIPLLLKNIGVNDIVIFTSEQGNDPTYSGIDHTRENVPVLVYSPKFKDSDELPYLQTLSDIGATIADNFDIKIDNGKSFLERLK